MTREEVVEKYEKKIEDIKAKYSNTEQFGIGMSQIYGEFIDDLEALKTDVVRCGECMYSVEDYCAFWNSDSILQEVLPNDFCSKGERRTE